SPNAFALPSTALANTPHAPDDSDGVPPREMMARRSSFTRCSCDAMQASTSRRDGLAVSSLSSAIRYVSTAASSPRKKLFSCSTEDLVAMVCSFVGICRQVAATSAPGLAELGIHDVARERHALVAQRGAAAAEELFHLVLGLAAPRACAHRVRLLAGLAVLGGCAHLRRRHAELAGLTDVQASAAECL